MIAQGPIFGTSGMVVSGHPLATLAAWRTLDGGGSVVDAAISGAAVLAVVLPQACTIGGDAFMLMHDARAEKTFGLNASGPAPVSTDPQRFADGIPAKGPLSMSVPGVVGGWRAAHDQPQTPATEGFCLSEPSRCVWSEEGVCGPRSSSAGRRPKTCSTNLQQNKEHQW